MFPCAHGLLAETVIMFSCGTFWLGKSEIPVLVECFTLFEPKTLRIRQAMVCSTWSKPVTSDHTKTCSSARLGQTEELYLKEKPVTR